MKNILKALAVALLMAATVIPATAKKPFLSEKEQAKIEKAAEKEAKKTAKEKKKEGWKVEQTGLMENIIARHIVKRETEGLQEKTGRLPTTKAAAAAANRFSTTFQMLTHAR